MITFLSILGILALLGIVATISAMLGDGYRPAPTDWTQVHERRDEPGLDPIADDVATAPPTAAHAAVPRRRAARRAARVRAGATR
ncbi:hypothetical protein [Microbacterium sp. GXF7504]